MHEKMTNNVSHHYCHLYPEWMEARFITRRNRFVMELRQRQQLLQAYVPNTGRMSEFLVKDQPFYVTPQRSGSYPFRVVATRYQDQIVFLDTVRVNDIFYQLLKYKKIEQFQNARHLRREIQVGNSRFDFGLHQGPQLDTLIEVKSCTLCHNGTAMFPDAPTLRGQKHLSELDGLGARQYETYIVFLVLNYSAQRFYPNFHTDYEYGQLFKNARNVRFNAYKLDWINPVTCDINGLHEIPIDKAIVQDNCRNRGSYLLLLENLQNRTLNIGQRQFKAGFYVYVGSALQGLESRIRRHQSRRKKHFWHIDYITPEPMNLRKVFPIRRKDKIEVSLARALAQLAEGRIPGFGASDSRLDSHLFYFRENPIFQRDFSDIVLNFSIIT
jgi:sugar fermentation stimulation protein A